jgi:hypothetical protein
MNLNLDQQVSVLVLKALVGFSGKTDLGATRVNKTAGGNFTIHVSDFQGDRLRDTSFIFNERGKQILSGSELPAQLEFGPPGTQSSHEYVSMPFTAQEVIAAISKTKAQAEG